MNRRSRLDPRLESARPRRRAPSAPFLGIRPISPVTIKAKYVGKPPARNTCLNTLPCRRCSARHKHQGRDPAAAVAGSSRPRPGTPGVRGSLRLAWERGQPPAIRVFFSIFIRHESSIERSTRSELCTIRADLDVTVVHGDDRRLLRFLNHSGAQKPSLFARPNRRSASTRNVPAIDEMALAVVSSLVGPRHLGCHLAAVAMVRRTRRPASDVAERPL